MILEKIKKTLWPWHSSDEWIRTDSGVVHEVSEDYGEAVNLELRWAETYRHRATGEVRRRVASTIPGSPVTFWKDHGDPEMAVHNLRSLTLGQVSSVPRSLFEAGDIDLAGNLLSDRYEAVEP